MSSKYIPISYNVFRQALRSVDLFPRKLEWGDTFPHQSSGVAYVYFSKWSIQHRVGAGDHAALIADITGALIECIGVTRERKKDTKLDFCFRLQIKLLEALPEDFPVLAPEPLSEPTPDLDVEMTYLMPHSADELLERFVWFVPARRVDEPLDLRNRFAHLLYTISAGILRDLEAMSLDLSFAHDPTREIEQLIALDPPLTLAEIDAIPEYMPTNLAGGSDFDRGVS